MYFKENARGSEIMPSRAMMGNLFSSRARRYSLAISRGGPMRTGWNSTAAASVHKSDSASNLPMLEVPGWLDSQRLPKAVAVVMALKMTARVRLDCRSPVCPARQAMM